MHADSFPVAKVFSNGGDIHFRLPYFQREYAWERENWQTLFNDIEDLYGLYGDNQKVEHFMGSLVVIQEGAVHGTVPVFKLVDGQQRLITISLMLCALADLIKTSSPDQSQKIRKYITNPDETEDYKYKILPTAKYKDRETYEAILDGRDLTGVPAGSRIRDAFAFYKAQIARKLDSGEWDPDRLFLILVNCLQVVFIDLNSDEKPYQIFESLNAKGKPLTQADLIRNYIAMKLPESHQPEMFDRHWSKIEEMLQEKRTVGLSRLGELTAFFRHYLAFRSGNLCNSDHVYERFRDRMESEFGTTEEFEREVVTLQRFATYYDGFLRPENESDPEIRDALKRLDTLEMATGYPLLLAMRDAMDNHQISREEYVEGLKLLENYMVRRYLAGEPTNYLNKAFPTFWKDIDIDNFVPSLKQVLLAHNYPSDYALRSKALTLSFYDTSAPTRAKTTLVLETINRHLSLREGQGGFTVLNGDPTIEHILPQTPSNQWKTDLGDQFNLVYEQYLNTLGNLTLVTPDWNTALSNSAFTVKKDKLATHALALNHRYFSQDIPKWDATAIQDRANFLLKHILEIWPAIGEPPAPSSTTGRYPVRLKFMGREVPVASWRDVAEKTTEIVIELTPDFDAIAQRMPYNLAKQPFPRSSRPLSNGWYMNTNLSSHSLISYSKQLAAAAGLPVDSWEVELS